VRQPSWFGLVPVLVSLLELISISKVSPHCREFNFCAKLRLLTILFGCDNYLV
jgi:hypothetical protein